MTDIALQVDWRAVEFAVVDPAMDAARATAAYVAERAKYYAPVRAIFARSRQRAKEPKLRRQISLGANTFTAKGIGAARFSSQQHLTQLQRSGPRNRLVQDPGGIGRVLGHPNSLKPVFRFGKTNETGDYRRVDSEGNLATVDVTRNTRRGGRVQTSYGEASGEEFLTSRGRYEVKSGRATYAEPREVKDSESGLREIRFSPPRVGGRLRSEIFATPIEPYTGGSTTIWAYVVSPTPYARFQEFGSSHNRAHPFMRPALYDGRAEFRKQIRRAYRKR